jgi:hypothetical protein
MVIVGTTGNPTYMKIEDLLQKILAKLIEDPWVYLFSQERCIIWKSLTSKKLTQMESL